ncbi:hypothetical protein [Amycolatopsis sp. NPDC052450]|uniref:hypothetical protein n=1 Tax=Amycolatopsis sp. NPDC052450 TaxID=3363937 RepID=UPI0037C6C490
MDAGSKLWDAIPIRVKDPTTEQVEKATAAETAANAQVQQNAHGPGIYLDRDHAETMLKKASDVLRQLRDDQSITQSLERMKSAAEDPVSVAFTKAATWNDGQPGAFAYGAGHVRLEILYLEELSRRLKEALGQTCQNDQEAGKTLGGITQEGEA